MQVALNDERSDPNNPFFVPFSSKSHVKTVPSQQQQRKAYQSRQSFKDLYFLENLLLSELSIFVEP